MTFSTNHPILFVLASDRYLLDAVFEGSSVICSES